MIKVTKVVGVEWEDARSWSSWTDVEEAAADFKPVRCYSVGLLVRADRHVVILALTMNEDRSVGDTCAIPRSWVRRIEVIRVIKKGSRRGVR